MAARAAMTTAPRRSTGGADSDDGGARRRTRSGGAVALGIGAGVASGLACWAASPVVGSGWAAWVALVPAFAATLALPGRAGRLAVPLAYALTLELLLVPALPLGLGDGYWGGPPDFLMPFGSPLLPVALIVIPALGVLLFAIGFGRPWLVERPVPLPGWLRAIGVIAVPAAAWVSLEFLRVKLDPGSPWALLATSQAGTPARELADLGGPWLVAWALIAVNVALALAVVSARTREPVVARGLVRRGPALAASGATLAVVAALVAGAHLLPAAGDEELTVAAVQPGYNTVELTRGSAYRLRPGHYERTTLWLVEDLGRLSMRAAARGARLIVWPEAVTWVDPREEPAVRAAVRRVARAADATIVVPRFAPDLHQGETLLVGPDGRFSRPQAKQRPMWYIGEDGGNRHPHRPVRAAGVSVGTMLGVDNADPETARRLVAAGATVITSSTHDWRQLAVVQRAFTRTHTAFGAPVVRADWRFGSAIFDGDGTVVADAGTARQRTVAVARVHVRERRPPSVAVGEIPAFAALAIAIGAGIGGAVAAPARARRRGSR